MNQLEEKSNEVSIVIYDAPRPPRYLKFNKSFLSWMFYGIPLLIGVLIIGSFIMAISPRQTSVNIKTPSLDLPTSIGEQGDEDKIKEAQTRIKELETENLNLQNITPIIYSDRDYFKDTELIYEWFDFQIDEKYKQPTLWSYPKLKVLSTINEPFIHLDNDLVVDDFNKLLNI